MRKDSHGLRLSCTEIDHQRRAGGAIIVVGGCEGTTGECTKIDYASNGTRNDSRTVTNRTGVSVALGLEAKLRPTWDRDRTQNEDGDAHVDVDLYVECVSASG